MMKKRMLFCLLYIWTVIMVGNGCEQTMSEPLDELYMGAVEDAVFADEDEIYGDLLAISQDNVGLFWNDGMVLVVVFTSFPDRYPEGESIQTRWGDTWVTAVPELQTFFEDTIAAGDDPVLRTEQLLGLPQNSGNEWFAELWVDPQDLFRPCPDSEIIDTVCALSFPDNATEEHIDWFTSQILEAYFQEQKYPWTRLGYTYDWEVSADEIGLSEFVIRQDAEVFVERLEGFEDYL